MNCTPKVGHQTFEVHFKISEVKSGTFYFFGYKLYL